MTLSDPSRTRFELTQSGSMIVSPSRGSYNSFTTFISALANRWLGFYVFNFVAAVYICSSCRVYIQSYSKLLVDRESIFNRSIWCEVVQLIILSEVTCACFIRIFRSPRSMQQPTCMTRNKTCVSSENRRKWERLGLINDIGGAAKLIFQLCNLETFMFHRLNTFYPSTKMIQLNRWCNAKCFVSISMNNTKGIVISIISFHHS